MFEKFLKEPVNAVGINPRYFVSLPGCTWQCGLKYTDIKLQKLQDREIILSLEKYLRGGISSVFAESYVKSEENEKILYIDANSLCGKSMSQQLPYADNKIDGNVKLEDNLVTPVDSDIGFLLEVDLKYPYERKDKTKSLPFTLGRISPQDNIKKLMKDIKPYEIW